MTDPTLSAVDRTVAHTRDLAALVCGLLSAGPQGDTLDAMVLVDDPSSIGVELNDEGLSYRFVITVEPV